MLLAALFYLLRWKRETHERRCTERQGGQPLQR